MVFRKKEFSKNKYFQINFSQYKFWMQSKYIVHFIKNAIKVIKKNLWKINKSFYHIFVKETIGYSDILHSGL